MAATETSSRWIRIIPVAFVMYTIAFIDRTNISLALPRISLDLHLDPQQAGTAAGIFYWGYLALQIPGGHLAKWWSPKKFISVLLVAWAIAAVGCGFAHTYRELLFLRLLLGVAESGVFPATLILLSHWFSRAERARANAFWFLCLPGAVILSAPFSGWMLDHWGWRTMLIAEGALPIAWLAVWLALIQDHPAQAEWLPETERDALVTTLRREACDLEGGAKVPYLRALFQPQVFVLSAVYFCFVSGQMGLLFWLPSAMGKFKGLSNLSTGILYTLPFIVGAISLALVGRHSDKMHERRYHGAAAMLFGGCCILLAVGDDLVLPVARVFAHYLERRRNLWSDGCLLGHSHGNLARQNCRVGHGFRERAGQFGRLLCALDRRLSQQKDWKLSLWLCIFGRDHRGCRGAILAAEPGARAPHCANFGGARMSRRAR